MNQADPSCGWKARRQAVHSVAAQSKASTTIETKNSWPQRILVADMSREDAYGGRSCNGDLFDVAASRSLAQRSASQRERSRRRPKLQSTPPGPAIPLTCLPRAFSGKVESGRIPKEARIRFNIPT